MNRNEQRKLNTILGKLFNLIGEYKSINNAAYIHFNELYTELTGLDDPAKIEASSGSQLSLSALYDKITGIGQKYGKPEFELEGSIKKNTLGVTARIFLLYKKHKQDYDNYDFIHMKGNNVEQFISDMEKRMEENFKDYEAYINTAPEMVVTEQVKEETEQS